MLKIIITVFATASILCAQDRTCDIRFRSVLLYGKPNYEDVDFKCECEKIVKHGIKQHHAAIVMGDNAFVLLSPYRDSVVFKIGDFADVYNHIKIKLYYYEDSIYIAGSNTLFDSVFCKTRDYRKIGIKMSHPDPNRFFFVDNLYAFSLVFELDSTVIDKRWGHRLPSFIKIKSYKCF